MTTDSREIVLLRGVNVGGRPLSMAALRDALTAAGFTDVVTYIQSGNVVLTPPKRRPVDMRRRLERLVAEVAGYDVPVVLRTREEIDRTVASNPYPGAGGKQLHVVFFAERPPKSVVDEIDVVAFSPEHCTLLDRDLYLHLPGGMGRAKLPLALDKAATKADPRAIGTARNWNTVLKLADLARG